MSMPSARVATACYALQRARPADIRTVSTLLVEAARWMNGRGYDAWRVDGFPDQRILPWIEAGTCWILTDPRAGGRPVATFTLDALPDPEHVAADLVIEGEKFTDALVLHKMAVARHTAGQGISTLILEWALDRTARSVVDPRTGVARQWLWLNVARRARPLQAWYALHGFEHVTTVEVPGRKSGMLMRRFARVDARARNRFAEAKR
ncbi:hypothetical protein AB0395_22055 [Streptosporangium sp. NPDC051023]|uniref:hypothetical protein n=1 Tax=Streptosporangium sp. NPDC051023 TaxID=3155410 RepID=UPI0034502054